MMTVLEPTIDFGDQDNELSEIPLTFDHDLNMSQVLSWGSENGLLRSFKQGNSLRMIEVSGRWSHDKLDETVDFPDDHGNCRCIYLGPGCLLLLYQGMLEHVHEGQTTPSHDFLHSRASKNC